jgi:hypothetical protein
MLIALPVAARPQPAASRRPTASIAPAGETPEERLARARQAYLNNDFPSTIAAATDLLYPEVKLRSEDDVQGAHRLLALAYFLSRAEGAAEHEFSVLLALRPDFALDPVVDPPQAIAFLDRIKARERKRLDEIERRRREEAEAAARDEERRRQDEEDRRIREAEERVRRTLKPVVVPRSRLVAMVPFGAGQFQNEQRVKGALFLASQLALGATSLGLWAALEVKYEFGRTKVPRDDLDSARAMQVAAIVSGGLFWADVIWGIIDAQVLLKPRVIQPEAAPAARLGIGPYVPSGGGAGLSLVGAF